MTATEYFRLQKLIERQRRTGERLAPRAPPARALTATEYDTLMRLRAADRQWATK